MRDDLRGRLAPRELSAFLSRFGRNDFGEPLFRLVWGLSRVERSGGIFRQHGTERFELRIVRRYPLDAAWLVEAWRPARCYGSPETWYAPVAEGGTRLMTSWGTVCCLGDYPSRGDYEDIGARMFWMPSMRQLEAVVHAFERGMARAANPRQRAALRTRAAEAAEAEADRGFTNEALAMMADADLPFSGAPMASMAGEKRRPALVSLAESMGIASHPY